ncbi:MAG: (2Fe-2S)-binding protein [Coprothermobacterota bacterium]|nr:(2Fe-2S)-binding protein [Coprothermobacterota bacterium]
MFDETPQNTLPGAIKLPGAVYTISVEVNGKACTEEAPAQMTLLQFLRERLFLTGAKEGCGVGECGACTVLLNGRAVDACLVLAVEADQASVRTVEGEARDGELTLLQRAFIEHGAVQCGFCTSGMLLSAQSLLESNPHPNREEIVEAISGNLCRCTGYVQILEAIEAVGEGMEEGG